jgi:integrase
VTARATCWASVNRSPDARLVETVGLHERHSFVALDSGVTLAEAAVLARHANAKVTGPIYARVNEQAKAKIASKLTDAGFGS